MPDYMYGGINILRKTLPCPEIIFTFSSLDLHHIAAKFAIAKHGISPSGIRPKSLERAPRGNLEFKQKLLSTRRGEASNDNIKFPHKTKGSSID